MPEVFDVEPAAELRGLLRVHVRLGPSFHRNWWGSEAQLAFLGVHTKPQTREASQLADCMVPQTLARHLLQRY
jgi:hypothetical protein